MGGHPSFQAFLAKYPKTRYLDAYFQDLSCVFRGKRYPVDQAGKLFSSGLMIPGGSFLLGVNGDSMDPEGMGFSDGDPDELGMPVPGTLVNCPWAQVPTGQFMVTLQGLDGEPYYYEPRNVLARVLDRFRELELQPVVAFELEFYLLDLARTPEGRIQVPVGPLTGQRGDTTQVYSMDDVEEFGLFLDEVTRTCREQGVETGAITGEYAPGQVEINLAPAPAPPRANPSAARRSADRAPASSVSINLSFSTTARAVLNRARPSFRCRARATRLARSPSRQRSSCSPSAMSRVPARSSTIR